MTMQGKHGAEAGTEELRQEVDRARHELGETVEQLAAKADVKAVARQKVEQARGRARDAAVSAREIAGSEQGRARARQGGVVIVSAGALALGAVWLRRRRTSRTTPQAMLRTAPRTMSRTMSRTVSQMRRGRGRKAPVQVRLRTGQRRAVTVRRTGRC